MPRIIQNLQSKCSDNENDDLRFRAFELLMCAMFEVWWSLSISK